MHRTLQPPRLLLFILLTVAFALGSKPVANPPTGGRPATVRTVNGDVLVGEVIELNSDRVVIRTALGDLDVALDKVAAVEFGRGSTQAGSIEAVVNLPGYSVVDATADAAPEFPEIIRVYIGTIEPERARANVKKKLTSKATARRLGDRRLEIVEEAAQAEVILLREVGDDVRSKVGSGTTNRSYIDIHGGGGLKTAPVTSVYTIETVDVRSAVVQVDRKTQALRILHDETERVRTRTTRYSGLDVARVLLDIIAPATGEEAEKYYFP